MIVVPLGVSSATPTVNRSLPSVALWRDGQVFLFDCGENAQTRMLQAGIKRSKIDYIFISHLDGDHYFGLLGLLSTLNLQRRENELTIVGPAGIKKFVEFNLDIANIDMTFKINFVELKEGFDQQIVVDEADLFVEARPLEHTKFCVGYRLQEKDKPGKVDADKAKELGVSEDAQFKQLKKGEDVTLEDGTVVKAAEIVGEPRIGNSFAYVTDTVYCNNAVELAKNASILYHEATFGHSLEDKAKETGHSTAEQAAAVAKNAKAKLLVIGHFSGRYTNEFVLMKEARRLFNDTWLATELRPIMTDPKHEKGIITPNVDEEKPADTRKPSYNKRKFSNGRSGDKRKKFKKRTVVGSSNPNKFSEYYRGSGGGRSSGRDDRNRDGNRENRDHRDSRDRRNNHDRDYRDNRNNNNRRNDRNDRNDRNNRNDRNDRDNRNHNRSNDNPKYKPITPRTPFDEFNRF